MTKFDPKIYERDVFQDSIYSAWLKYSNERDVLEKVFRKKINDWCTKSKLSILDIGCGTGSAALRIFKILNEKGVAYEYTGIDPYKDQLERFKESIFYHHLPQKNIELIVSKIEDFQTNKKYDLAVVVHSLYYVDDLERVIKKIFSLADKLVIVHHGKYGINEVHQAFHSLVRKGPNIIGTYEKIARILDSLKIPYNLEIYDTYVDVSSCKDPKNEDGRKLIKFFLEHSVLSEDIIEEVSKWFRTKPDIMRHDVGYFFITR